MSLRAGTVKHNCKSDDAQSQPVQIVFAIDMFPTVVLILPLFCKNRKTGQKIASMFQFTLFSWMHMPPKLNWASLF